MTDDPTTTPGDLVGSVREVQRDLRERYGATAVDIADDDMVEFHDPPTGDTEKVGREERLRFELEWYGPDIPQETGKSRVVSALELLSAKVNEAEDDFPEAEISAYTNGNRVKLNLEFGQREAL